MTPKPARAELLAVRTLTEQRWAYDRRMEHLSYRGMRQLVSQAPPVGLGYDLSEHTLKALVTGYLARMREVHEVDLDEHRERELEDLDIAQQRLDAIAGLAAKSLARAAELHAYDVHAGKAVIAATNARRAAGESRRRLLGLDAPQQTKVDVVHHDGVTEELNAMLARLGEKPIEVDHE